MSKYAQRVRIAVVMSPHYPPSGDVGARRVASIATLLAHMGMPVLVVSQSGSGSSAPGPLVPGGISTIRVAPTRRLLLDKLPPLKRALLGRFAGNGSDGPAAEQNAETDPGAPAASRWALLSQWATYLKLRYFRLVYLIDGHKRWSFLAYRAARRATLGLSVDLVVASGPPFSCVIAAQRLARVLNAPLIADFRDPMISGWVGPPHVYHPSNWVHRSMEARVVRGAHAITCAAPGLRSALAKA